ncbi:unnamed protein product, partial [Brassica rapa subsp. trilocularis]
GRRRSSSSLVAGHPPLFIFVHSSPLLSLLSSVSFSVALCLCASVRVRSGASDLDLRRSRAEEWMCGFSGCVEWRGFGSGVRSGLWFARSLSFLLPSLLALLGWVSGLA